MKYYELEPFGSLRDNLHSAIVATSVWQSNMEPRERDQVSPKDFMLDESPKKTEKLEPAEMFVMLKAHFVRGQQDVNR